jgi:hypothetical protein
MKHGGRKRNKSVMANENIGVKIIENISNEENVMKENNEMAQRKMAR